MVIYLLLLEHFDTEEKTKQVKTKQVKTALCAVIISQIIDICDFCSFRVDYYIFAIKKVIKFPYLSSTRNNNIFSIIKI